MEKTNKFIMDKLIGLESLSRSRALPLTIQRRAIMAELAARSDHPTADQVYDALRDRLPGISRTTVYRVLETFSRLNVVRKISNLEAKARFDARTARHHHLQCVVCGRVDDVHEEGLDRLPLPDCSRTGFVIHDYSVSFTGICAECHAVSGNKQVHEKESL